jgi:uncharacterized membrane protein YhaH (DUF805 family)
MRANSLLPKAPRSSSASRATGREITVRLTARGGRARRKEYWGFVLFSMITLMLVGGAAYAVGTALGSNEAEEPVWTTVATSLAGLALFIPSLAVTVRRQHDIGLSGWFILLWFIPWIGAMIILVFTPIPSQKHENRWGPIPEGIPV